MTSRNFGVKLIPRSPFVTLRHKLKNLGTRPTKMTSQAYNPLPYKAVISLYCVIRKFG